MKKLPQIGIALFAAMTLVAVTSSHAVSAVEDSADPAASEKSAAKDGEKPVEQVYGVEGGPQYLRKSSEYVELPSGEHQPWRAVRKLQKLQDDIVAGVPFAQDAYTEYLRIAAVEMDKLGDDAWEYERNLDALAVFLMFGGATELGYKALRKSSRERVHRIFLEAALSFVERDVGRAYGLMQVIDHTALPASMGAQLALAKSMTLSSSNLELSRTYLDEARRLAPGSLVEEASLRRLIRIAGETKSFESLKAYFQAYLMRFEKSYYFNDFVRNFGFAAVRMPARHETEILEMLNHLVRHTTTRQTASIAVYVARYAAISARSQLAAWSEMQTKGKLRPNSKLHTRMKLYAAASRIVMSEETMRTMETAGSISPEMLDQGDVKILNAVNLIGDRILMNQENMLLELETRMSAPDRSQKQKETDLQEQEVIRNEVEHNPVVQRATTLFEEIGSLAPELAQ
ncbi:MAG: hypothetical protein JJ891_07860 [Rhizobiaceae bacterium]|nr:hypothetical protein [Rhizobiaceae bacterium]